MFIRAPSKGDIIVARVNICNKVSDYRVGRYICAFPVMAFQSHGAVRSASQILSPQPRRIRSSLVIAIYITATCVLYFVMCICCSRIYEAQQLTVVCAGIVPILQLRKECSQPLRQRRQRILHSIITGELCV